ncbi:MAG: carboxypeptidase regulatory-like domain-containing protein [Acidobacteriaceae bacterium]|nr:carboxypeptidase regulatory-like domain-containing protein [Acidobacteriaceae bacterium]
MNTKQRHLFFFAAVFAVLASPVRTNAQTTYGSIVGTVTDPSGSAVAGTEVVLTNLGTGEKRTEPTNSDGLYQFVNILPVQYSVSIEKPGFKRVVRTPITVETETTTRIDLTLQVGEVSQTVEVTAQTPLLQPETSSLGTVVEQKQLNELPLNGRNPMNLVARRWCHRVNRNRTRMARIRSRGAIIRSAAVWRTRA